ncbi:spore germination protein [Paenibacillus silvisoli]|nr:spore germination protein [Paenibacillus silvisoli]
MDQGQSDEFSMMLPVNLARIEAIMGQNSDFITREVAFANRHRAAIFYLDGMVDKHTVQQSIISALLDRCCADDISVSYIMSSVLDAGELSEATSFEASMEQLLSGSLLLLLEGFSSGILISLPD